MQPTGIRRREHFCLKLNSNGIVLSISQPSQNHSHKILGIWPGCKDAPYHLQLLTPAIPRGGEFYFDILAIEGFGGLTLIEKIWRLHQNPEAARPHIITALPPGFHNYLRWSSFEVSETQLEQFDSAMTIHSFPYILTPPAGPGKIF